MQAPEARPAPVLRNVLLLIGFLALVAVGIVTVLLPELEDEPGPDAESAAPAAGPAAR